MIDSGASFHVASRDDFFTSYSQGDYGCIRTSNEGLSKIVGMVDICFQTNIGCRLLLKDVRYVPDLSQSYSTGKLDDEDFNNQFGDGK